MRNRLFIILGLTVVVLGGLFIYLQPKPQPQNHSNPAPQAETSKQETKTFDLQITNGELTSGESTLTVSEGDEVTLIVKADKKYEMHLHGYDKELKLAPDEENKLTLTADKTGRFEIELHDTSTVIAALEVQPKQ